MHKNQKITSRYLVIRIEKKLLIFVLKFSIIYRWIKVGNKPCFVGKVLLRWGRPVSPEDLDKLFGRGGVMV
jgi:hypothetical protein